MTGEDDDALCCSFCGKSERDVVVIVPGPAVYICDECLGLCIGEAVEAHPELLPKLLAHANVVDVDAKEGNGA